MKTREISRKKRKSIDKSWPHAHKPRGQTMKRTCLLAFILFYSILATEQEDKIAYKFPEFLYKGTSKNEIAFREFETACEQSPDCTSRTGTERFACIRRCISPSCHQDLYGHDPLEEGEIDVRLNSFKGCFIQRLNRPRQ